MVRSPHSGLLIAALAIARAAAAGSAPDDAALERAGCLVRTAAVDARGVATVAAECHWALAPSAVVAALHDPATLRHAVSSLREFDRLPDGRIVQVHEIGWPLEDRQVTLDWRETPLAGGGLLIEVTPSARQEPVAAGRQAIAESLSHWEIRPDGSGGSVISYRSRYDAGGNLKPWLVRRFQKFGVAESLAGLRGAIASR